jgi:hypothetical protein
MIAGELRQRWAAIAQEVGRLRSQCALKQEVAAVGSYSVAAVWVPSPDISFVK